MAAHTKQLTRRLRGVRRRWRITTALHGLLLVATETVGLFMVFLLANAMYPIPGEVGLVMLWLGGGLLAVLFVRQVLYPLLRRLPDEQIALLIEERSPQVEGAVITALEVDQQKRGGLYGFIANFLVDDAVRRIDRSHMSVVGNLGQLKRHAAAAAIVLLVFAGTSLLFRGFISTHGVRVIMPWRSIGQDAKAPSAGLTPRPVVEEIGFEKIAPGNVRLLRGGGINVTVTLTREPTKAPLLYWRSKRGEWSEANAGKMGDIQAVDSYAYPLPDINEDKEYYIAVGDVRSEIFEAKVYDLLGLRHIQLTYHYPEYVQRKPHTRTGLDGDVEVLTGTKVEMKVVANNRLKTARITFDEKRAQAMSPGANADEGASASFVVDKDSFYRLTLEDADGQEYVSSGSYHIKALPDEPPTVEMAFPRVDMTVHPLCEVTFKGKVTDDYGIKDVRTKLQYYRGEKLTPIAFELKPKDGELVTLADGSIEYIAEHVWELEGHKPSPAVGDMMFYYFEVTDRKGQVSRTDIYNIRLLPTEVVANWPDEVSPPDLPHWDYYRVPDLTLFIAAAWHIEQQRGRTKADDFNGQCEKLAEKMAPNGELLDFFGLSQAGQAMMGTLNDAQKAIVDQASAKLNGAHKELLRYQPGKAAEIMTLAQAIVEGVLTDKRLFGDIQIASEPMHTGQPSGGFSDDPTQAQLTFTAPTLMSDSLTAFQQQDNPDHHLPPDYRRSVKLKKRTGALTKQLKAAGEIYASEEMLIEMAKETIGHIRLREAQDLGVPNEVAAAPAGGDRMIRVDKRAIPWAKLDRLDPGQGDGEKPKLGEKPGRETIKGLGYEKLKDNERRGGSNPHRSQTAGGTGGDPEDDEKDPNRKPPPKPEDLNLRPSQQQNSSSGGGGQPSGQQQPQQPNPAGGQPAGGQQKPSQTSAIARALADRQQGIAAKAEGLARAVTRSMGADDPVAKEALSHLRGAARQMRSAEEGFRQGQLSRALTHAQAARRQMQTAMNILKIGQYDNLEQALDAAQRGAETLAQNQNRITRATGLIAARVGKLVGKTPADPSQLDQQAGKGQAGKGQPAKGQTSKGQPGTGQPAKGQTGRGQPGTGQPGTGEPGKGQPAKGQTGKGEPGKGQPAKGQPGKGEPGKGQPAKGQTGKGEPGKGEPGKGQPGKGQPGVAKGAGGDEITRKDLKKAAESDPRLGGQLRKVSAEQSGMAKEVAGFTQYVEDLKDLAAKAGKDRVSKSVGGVAKAIKDKDIGQTMIDTSITLNTGDLTKAQAAQRGVEQDIRDIMGELQATGDLLSGSPTGVLAKRVKTAKRIGKDIRRLAGIPSPGQGDGQPGDGQPGKGQPGAKEPGKGQPGKTGAKQPGKGQPDKAGSEQPGKQPGSLADRLAGGDPSSSQPGGDRSGQGVGTNRDIEDVFWRTRRFSSDLRRDQLTDADTIKAIQRKVVDIDEFKRMFAKANKAQAGGYADVVLGVGRDLEAALKEALSAKRLNAEQREEYPPKYRVVVNAYFEALSKAVSQQKK